MTLLKVIKILLSPLLFYFRWLVQTIKLLINNPTIKLSSNAIVTNSNLGKYNYLCPNSVLNNSSLGDFSYIGEFTKIRNAEIGKFTCIGPNVLMGLGEHPSHTFTSIHPIFYSTIGQVGLTFADQNYFNEFPTRITIGNDVWIGANVIISKTVKIGDGAIIASGSIITKDVPPYSIVGGVPAKHLKNRFDDSQIKFLTEYKWWDKDISWLKRNYKYMHDIQKLIELQDNE